METRNLTDALLQVLEEQWSNGTLSATTGYVYGDALISRTVTHPNPSQEGTFYYHYDGMGSVRGLTDSAGSLTDAYTYDAYGNLLDKTGSTINPYRYRGEQYDADLSSYYLRARYYQPGIGRFLTTDPVEGFSTDPLSRHPYMYGNCDPVNTIDPTGKISLVEKLTVLAIIGINTLPIVAHYSQTLQDGYATLGEKWFVDAYIRF